MQGVASSPDDTSPISKQATDVHPILAKAPPPEREERRRRLLAERQRVQRALAESWHAFMSQLRHAAISAPRTALALNPASHRAAHLSFGPPGPHGVRLPLLHRNSKEQIKLARWVGVVKEIQASLHRGGSITIRDVYYADVPLFGQQRTVERIIQRLQTALQVDRQALGLVASSRSLFHGPVRIVPLGHGATAPTPPPPSPAVGREASLLPPALIPDDSAISHLEPLDRVEWILVVEKDAVFHTMAEYNLVTGTPGKLGPGVILTGRGYPDLAARAFLATLQATFPHAPAFALTDGDPHGLDIVRVYRAHLDPDRTLHWLGLRRGDVPPIFAQDRRKAIALLQHPLIPPTERLELSRMLWEGTKCEFEISNDPLLARPGERKGEDASHGPTHPSVQLVVQSLVAALAQHTSQ